MDEHGFHNDGWYLHDGEGNGILYVLAIVFGAICPPIGLIFFVMLLFK